MNSWPGRSFQTWNINARLRRGDRGISVAHQRTSDESTFNHHLRFDAEERRLPQDEVCELSNFDGTDMFANPMRDGRIDSVLGNVALHPKVVVVGKVLIQFAALTFHLVRGLPCAANDLADSSHR